MCIHRFALFLHQLQPHMQRSYSFKTVMNRSHNQHLQIRLLGTCYPKGINANLTSSSVPFLGLPLFSVQSTLTRFMLQLVSALAGHLLKHKPKCRQLPGQTGPTLTRPTTTLTPIEGLADASGGSDRVSTALGRMLFGTHPNFLFHIYTVGVDNCVDKVCLTFFCTLNPGLNRLGSIPS